MTLVLDSLKTKSSLETSGRIEAPSFRISGTGTSSNMPTIDSNGVLTPTGMGTSLASSITKLLSSSPSANGYFGVSTSIYGDTTAIGSYNDSGQGAVFIFVKTNGVWQFQAKLVGSDTVAGDSFGISVSLYGDTLVVGASDKPSDALSTAGSAYVFVRVNGTWSQQAILTPSTVQAAAQFGYPVSVYEDTVAVGAYNEDLSGANMGAVYIFTRSGVSWSLQAKLVSDIPQAGAVFGISISLYSDTIAVGASDETVSGFASAGRVRVFTRNGGVWSQSASIVSTNAGSSFRFGTALSLFSNTLAISAYNEDQDLLVVGVGAIYVFTSSGNTWSLQTKITAPAPETNLRMGQNMLSLFADTLAFDIHPSNVSGVSYPGQILVYSRRGSSWSLAKTLNSTNPQTNGDFGISISVYGNTIAVGADLEDVTFSNQGTAYIFDASLEAPKIYANEIISKEVSSESLESSRIKLLGTGASSNIPTLNSNGVIIPTGVGTSLSSSITKMISTTPGASDGFGAATSIYGDTAAIGSYSDSGKGAVFIFVKTNGVWQFQAKLVGSDTVAGDRFGFAISLYGDTLAVGAFGKAGFNGSAYIFTRAGGVWSEQAVIPSPVGGLVAFGASISLHENTVAMGAPFEIISGGRGTVYIFTRSGVTWTQKAKLLSDLQAFFGFSVSLYSDTIAVGDEASSGGVPKVRIFIRDKTTDTWLQTAVLSSGLTTYFGANLSLHTDTLAISAHRENQAPNTTVGAIYIYVYSGGTWNLQKKITAEVPSDNLFMGSGSVSLYGDTLAFDTNFDGLLTGRVLVYTRNGTTWSLAKTLNATTPQGSAYFGYASSVYGNTIIVGAYQEDGTFADQGAAYMFDASLDAPKIYAKDLVIKNTSAELTIANSQSTNQTLSLPNITQADTAIVSLLPQTEYRKVLVGGQDVSTAAIGSLTTPIPFVVSAGNPCIGAVFSADGLEMYVASEGGTIYIYSLIKQNDGTVSASLARVTGDLGILDGICISHGNTTPYLCVSSSTTQKVGIFLTTSTVLYVGIGIAAKNPIPSLVSGSRFFLSGPSSLLAINTSFSIVQLSTGSLGLTISNPVALASVYINSTTEEVYFANGTANAGVSYATVTFQVGLPHAIWSAPAGNIPITDTLSCMVLDKKRKVIYASGANNIYVISIVSKTVTNTFPMPGPFIYLSLSNDTKYLYASLSTGSIKEINLSTLLLENTFSSGLSLLKTALPHPNNSSLFMIGDGTPQVKSINLKRTQYISYSVGQASQSGTTVTGFTSTVWNAQMAGGIVVFEDGTVCNISSDPSNITLSSLTFVTPSQTVALQNYTIYYGATIVGPKGSGIIGDRSVLINPRIVHSDNSTTSVSFDLSANVSGSNLLLKTTQTVPGTQTLSFPNLTTPDTFVTLAAPQTLTNKTMIMTSINNGGVINIPSGPDTFVTLTAPQTLTNKTMTSIINGGVINIPSGADTFATLAALQTFTNKTLTAPILTDSLWVSQATPAAGGVKIYGESQGSSSGRAMTSQTDSTGRSYAFQPFFGTKKIAMATADYNSSSSPYTPLSTFGMSFGPVVGTPTTPALTFTLTSFPVRLLSLTSASATNSSAYFANTNLDRTIPVGIGAGTSWTPLTGYHFVCKFAFVSNIPTSTSRIFIGLSSIVPGATLQPMGGVAADMIGLAKNSSGVTNFYTRSASVGASSGTVVTGFTWPPPTGSIYTFNMYQAPGTATAYMSLERSVYGTFVEKFQGTASANYPPSFLFPIVWVNTGTVATPVEISLISLYIETEN